MTRRGSLVRMGPRSTAALLAASGVGLLGFGWPLLGAVQQAGGEHAMSHSADAPWLFVALLPLLAAIVLAHLSEGGMDAKVVALLGMLTAVGAGLRVVSPGIAGIEPGFFLLVLAGYAFGPGFGFVLGALSMAAGGLFTAGIGPWLPFQMFAAGWVGALAGLLPGATRLHTHVGVGRILALGGYGVVAGMGYGMVMNLWFWPFATLDTAMAYVPGEPLSANLVRYGVFYLATSLMWDLTRGLVTAGLVWGFGRPLLRAFARTSRLAAFDATPAFERD